MYRRSKARRALLAEIVSLKGALSDVRSAKYSGSDIKTHVMCSVIFLASAKLETYLEDLLSDWIANVISSGLTYEKLPLSLRAFDLASENVEVPFRRFLAFRNEEEYLEALSKCISNNFFRQASDSLTISSVDVQRLCRKKYPSPENVSRLFARVGVSRMLVALNASARADLEGLLESFNDIRTEIAHSGVPAGINTKDVREKLTHIERIAQHIDRVFHRHVCGTTGDSTWPA